MRCLAALCVLSRGGRLGHLLANLSFFPEDKTDRTLWDIEDAELLQIIERHRADLSKRQPYVA
jgi:hypothetical protein